MLDDKTLVHGFQPLWLSVQDIGPFREKTWEFDFTDADGQPCNFFLLASKNGRGKTTVIELIATLVNILSSDNLESFGHEGLDVQGGRAQLDLLLRIFREGEESCVVLSLLAGTLGEDSSLKTWLKDDLEVLGAKSWHRYGYRRRSSGVLEPIGKRDALVADLTGSMKIHMGEAPQGFEDDPLTFPTLLYFSAYRDIVPVHHKRRTVEEPEWGYRPVHWFVQEGREWTGSLDNLLVWLKWLDDGRFERVLKIVNDRVFGGSSKFLKGIRKQPPEAIISNDQEQHRLDQLSSGEKSLVQLFIRMGISMTRNTIVLIDEMEVHLHPIWRNRLLYQLKEMVREYPGLTLIATTHSRDVMKAFAFEIREDGLRKGGHLIEADLGGQEVEQQ